MVAVPFDRCRRYVGYCDAWTLNASLTRLSSYRRCSKRRILGHSAQATSLLPIEGMTKCSHTAHGLGFGSILASVADLILPFSILAKLKANTRRTSGSKTVSPVWAEFGCPSFLLDIQYCVFVSFGSPKCVLRKGRQSINVSQS